MKIVKPNRLIAGFHADLPDPRVPELVHIGEQWVAEDFTITRHSHPVWEFYLQIDGWSLWQDEKGGHYECGPGSFLAPPPGLEHWLDRWAIGRHHFLFAAIDIEALVSTFDPNLASLWKTRQVIFIGQAQACENAFLELIRETTSPRSFRSDALRIALCRLLIETSRLVFREDRTATRKLWNLHPSVETVRNALSDYPEEPWRLSELGRLAGLSPNYLQELFLDQMGESPRAFHLRMRIDKAKLLLRTTAKSITEIAIETGFSSSQHFARSFRASCGCSATAFRELISE
jgi:AraC family transcriptional regulator